jgi:chromosome segregation ATPase
VQLQAAREQLVQHLADLESQLSESTAAATVHSEAAAAARATVADLESQLADAAAASEAAAEREAQLSAELEASEARAAAATQTYEVTCGQMSVIRHCELLIRAWRRATAALLFLHALM